MDACSGRIGNLKRLRHRERARRFELRNELFTRQKQIVIRRLVSAWLACVAIGGCKGVTDSGTGASEALYAITVLPGFGGDTTVALDLNQSGDIVGWGTDASGTRHAALWRNGAQLLELASNGPAIATAINDSGFVVGLGHDAATTEVCRRSVLWRNGNLENLAGWTGCVPRFLPSVVKPEQINRLGTVRIGAVGLVRVGVWQSMWPPAWVNGINNFDALVGSADNGGYGYYQPYATGVTLQFPSAFPCSDPHVRGSADFINDSGVIVGTVCGTLVRSSPTGGDIITRSGQSVRGLNNHNALLYQDSLTNSLTLVTGSHAARIRLDDPAWQLVSGPARLNDAGVIIVQAMNTPTGRKGAIKLAPK